MELPDKDEFGDNYELIGTNKYAFNKCFVRRERSQAERKFEQICEKNLDIDWWYKNGEQMKQYFAIEYVDYNERNREIRRAFYLDYRLFAMLTGQLEFMIQNQV